MPKVTIPKPAGERAFNHLQEVRAFLKVLGVGASTSRMYCGKLDDGPVGVGANVSISEKVLRNAGFVSIGNLARSN